MPKEKCPEVNLSSSSLQWILGGLATATLTLAVTGFAFTKEIEHRITTNEVNNVKLAEGQARIEAQVVENQKQRVENQAAVMKVLEKLANKH